MRTNNKNRKTIECIYKDFLKVKNYYRPVNFWGWNDEINGEMIKTQVSSFKSAGIGGFFIHSREGLKTEYLSEEWMKNVNIAIKKAKNSGLKCWLYDEDNFPSGYAGGKIPALGDKYWQEALICNISRRKQQFSDLFSVYSMEKEIETESGLNSNPIITDATSYVYKKISYSDIEKEILNGKDIIYLYIRKARPGCKIFNNYCYVDILDKSVVDAFIESTHEKYYDEFGIEFGKTIRGIFTDEPSILYYPEFPENSLPWTRDLNDIFLEKNGYKLEENLIYLYFNIKGYERIRFDYWKLVSELFLNNYTKNIHNWCKDHNILFTGHFMYEENLVRQVEWTGSVMPHYEYMDIPAIDKLFKTIDNPVTIKQVSSVANQLGKERVGSEVFGASGQSLSFEDMKWIADWQAALGINMLIPHISLYSLYGKRKRDYPPNIFFQQPWWDYVKYIFDYLSRLSYILSIGKYDAKVLVINPISSIWVSYSPLDKKTSEEISNYFDFLIKELLENQICFDIGDEEILLKHSKIKENKLIVGKSAYDTVIIPASINIYENTLTTIREFLENGGNLISIKPLPYMVNGIIDKKVEEILEKGKVLDLYGKLNIGNYFKKFDDNLIELLKANIESNISITDSSGNNIDNIYLNQRSGEGFKIFFLANISRSKRYDVNIRIMGEGNIEIWDLFNGKRAQPEIASDSDGGEILFSLNFTPVTSFLIVQYRSNLKGWPARGNKKNKFKKNLSIFNRDKIKKEIYLKNDWLFKKDKPNILLLDFCDLKIGNKIRFKNIQLCKALWKVLNSEDEEFSLFFKFYVENSKILENDIYLAIEEMKEKKIKINGKEAKLYKNTEYFLDPKIEKYKIGKYLRIGLNKIEVSSRSYPGIDFDRCYLLGDFLVYSERNNNYFRLEEIKPLIRKTTLLENGFPFYCGKFSFIKNFEIPVGMRNKVIVNCSNIISTISNVYINDKPAGRFYEKNFEHDITHFIKGKKNELRIEICTSLFNIFGPLHHGEGELYEVNPEDFCNNQTAAYNYKYYGLIGDVKILVY